jgi:hypothetical protein
MRSCPDHIYNLPSHFRRNLAKLLSEFVGLAIRVNSRTAEQFFMKFDWREFCEIFYWYVKSYLKLHLRIWSVLNTNLTEKYAVQKLYRKLNTQSMTKIFLFFAYNSYGFRDKVLFWAHVSEFIYSAAFRTRKNVGNIP